MAYFLAKVLADLPKMVASTVCVFAGLLTQFVSPMPLTELFGGLLILMVFAYFSGYFLSFLLPYGACGVAAIFWGVIWGLLFSGLIMVMSEDGDKNIHAISVPRWFNEGVYYASTVKPYSKADRGPSKGLEYYDFARGNQYFRFFQTYAIACGYALLITGVWFFIDLFTILLSHLHRKK